MTAIERANIHGHDFSIPVKYTAGPRDLTTAEAQVLQGVFRSNLLAFAAGRAKKLINGADVLSDDDAAELEAAVSEYSLKHAFGARVTRIGKPAPPDPVEVKALALIRAAIVGRLKLATFQRKNSRSKSLI